ncbi:MAG: ATP-binding protein [Acidobacteriota bacterium]
MSSPDYIDLSPSPLALLEALRSIGYTLDTALADIFDNSITAQATSISVQFLWNQGEPWLAVIDDGKGMTAEGLVHAMRFGSKNPMEARDPNDLGRFGLGLKTASISQCRRLTVVSKKNGKLSGCEWNLDSVLGEKADRWYAGFLSGETLSEDEFLCSFAAERLGDKKSGTIVLWRNLDQLIDRFGQAEAESAFSKLLDDSRHHLELVFHRFLSPEGGQRKIRIDFNGSELEAFNPFNSSHSATQELPSHTFFVEGKPVTVQPVVLPHHAKLSREEYEKYAGPGSYLHNQGFYVYRNKRLIIKGTWFRLIKKEELNKLIRVRVDIPNTLDHIWRIDIRKSQATPPESVRRELKQIIARIESAGKKVYRQRGSVTARGRAVPVWARRAAEGTVFYEVNDEHPAITSILQDSPPDSRKRFKDCLALISSTLPYDLLYHDSADDNTDLEYPEVDRERLLAIGRVIAKTLAEGGTPEKEIPERLLGIEPFSRIPDLVDEIFTKVGGIRCLKKSKA